MRPDLPPAEIKLDGALYLKRLQLSSSGIIFKTIDQDREHLGRWLPFVAHTRKLEDTELFIKSVLHTSCPKKDLIYEIWTGDEFAGLIALKEIDGWNKKTELGYWISTRFEGMGLVTRSCIALLDLSFDLLGLNRVQLKVAVGNARSCLVAERLNFKMEGIEREGEIHRHYRFDLVTYSMLKREWLERNGQ